MTVELVNQINFGSQKERERERKRKRKRKWERKWEGWQGGDSFRVFTAFIVLGPGRNGK